MQPGQSSTSSTGSSSGGSGASYSDSVIINQRRRFDLLTAEAPELDFATRSTIAKSQSSDADMVQMARSSISFASREQTINDLKSKSNTNGPDKVSVSGNCFSVKNSGFFSTITC
jgi:hypothetical protein